MDASFLPRGLVFLFLPLVVSANCLWSSPLSAQTRSPGPSVGTPSSGSPAAAGEDNDASVDELDVVAAKDYAHLPGAVAGTIKPEIQYSSAQVQAFGVSTVNELLGEFEFQTRTERESNGGSPLVLLNGRRISSLNEVANLPSEAILRVDILPEETAIQFGFPPTQRVVNIVLRRHFHATLAALEGGESDGGRAVGRAEADLLHLHHNRRLNIDLKYARSTDVTDADRGILEPASPAHYALGGNVLSPVAGAEIDPALSALVGSPVTIAGVPAVAGGGAPTLSDFAATAGKPNVTDFGRFHSLTPAVQSLVANAVFAQPLPDGINATFNATFSAMSSDALHGLPGLKLLVPGGDPFSPFAKDVLVDRSGALPRQQYVEGWTVHLGSVFDKQVRKWRYSLTGAYDHADTQADTDGGLDGAPLQALLDARSAQFNPFAPVSGATFTMRPQRPARSISDSADLQFLVSGPLLNIPAGAVIFSAKLGDAQAWQSSKPTDRAAFPSVRLSQNAASGHLNVDAPLLSRTTQILPFAGDFSINGHVSLDQVSRFGALKSFGYGLNWSPVVGLTLIASYSDREAAPTVEQRGAAAVSTPGARVFDFSTGQTVEATRITGGDPNLAAEHRRVFKLGLTMRPFSSRDLTFTANYIRSDVRNPITVIAAATPEFETAFPDRFVRDPAGDLVLEDDRPLNLARQERSEVRWGVNFSRRLGARPAAGSPLKFPPATKNGSDELAGTRTGSDRKPGAARAGEDRRFRTSSGSRIQFAIYHTLYLTDRETLRSGDATLDLLNGGPASFSGGQYVNEVDSQFGVVAHGFGARLTGIWRQGTTIHGAPGSPAGDLRFSDLTVVNLRLFNNFAQQKSLVARYPWLRGARLSLNITNLLDQHVSVRDRFGITPLAYQTGYLDPIGRTISVSVRKVFF